MILYLIKQEDLVIDIVALTYEVIRSMTKCREIPGIAMLDVTGSVSLVDF